MKRSLLFAGAVGVAIMGSVTFATAAFATVPPTLSLTATGTNDQVQVQVTGDPNQSVLLSYSKQGSGPVVVALGSTDGSGSFTETISSANYGLTSGTAVTAIIGGTSGPKSPTVDWPAVSAASGLVLSQNALIVSAGSSANVTATNASNGSIYVSNNSNPSIANVSISGNTVTVSGNVVGSTNVTLCTVGSTSNCPSVYVTVMPSGSSQLSFSQSNPTVVSGQNLPITISGGSGNYVLQNNSDANTVQATLSGSVLTLSTGASTGSSSVTVCTSDHAMCGVLVASASSASSAAVSFSSTAPSVAAGNETTVTVYGPTGVQFYVSSNSSPSTVQANLSGSTLTLAGIAAGSSSISVCASSGTCASLSVTVTNAVSSGTIALSQNALSLSSGQSATVTVSGGAQPYSVVGGSTSVAQTAVNGAALTVTAVGGGTSSVNVCSSDGGCTNLAISVNGSSNASSAAVLSPGAVSLTVGKSALVTLSGASSFYLSGNTNSGVATVAVSGTIASVAGLAAGSATATICASGGSCSSLPITVSPLSSAYTYTNVGSTNTGTSYAASGYTFTEYLAPGMRNSQVLELQKVLAAQGYFTHAATGYYGSVTKAAVTEFQAANGIEQLGVVGPSTRAALNALTSESGGSSASSASAGSSTDISSMSLSQLKATVQELQAQLNQVLARIAQLSG